MAICCCCCLFVFYYALVLAVTVNDRSLWAICFITSALAHCFVGKEYGILIGKLSLF